MGAAPPRCLCHMKPEPELATGISSDKDPQDTPLEPEPPSRPALTSCSPTMIWGSRALAQLLGCAWWSQPWLMSLPSPGSGVSMAWPTPWGLSAWTLDKVKENDQRHGAKCRAGHLISKVE